MKVPLDRRGLESKYNLTPCTVRFGILGRYQPEKQIEMMLEAFHRAANPEHQLLLTAYNDTTVIPDDARIIKLPRKQWLLRGEIAKHNHLCDALIAAQTGDTYLTSGMVGDAVGTGSAMIVPEWEFYREIIGEAGLYHRNTLDSLTQLLREVNSDQISQCREASKELQEAMDWVNLSPRAYSVFRKILI
jgi:hypothetical protein